ncbi:MAG: O-antigen ligase family protein [Lachnospiraceae bacterium]|nr:O-antigen ligase family protein [Lachnospiraceae bacterium]
MGHKTSLTSIVLDGLMILPVTTLLQGLIPSINKIIFTAVFIIMLLDLLANKIRLKDMLAICALCGLYIWAIIKTNGMPYVFNDLFYFAFFCIYTLFIVYRQKAFYTYLEVKKKYVLCVISIWSIIVLISLFSSTSYIKGGYFVSFSGNVFRLATASVYILSMVLLLVNSNKKYILYTILPMYCIFSGGSRTYLALSMVLFMMILYMVCGNRKVFVMISIPMIALLLIFLLNSNIMQKILETVQVQKSSTNEEFLRNFTSSRSVFWEADIKAYQAGNIFEKLFGYGFNHVYDVNVAAVHAKIYAHNDFINIALNFGMAGVVLYLIIFKKMYDVCKKNSKIKGVLNWGIIFIWLFNAMFNMFYTYFCSVAAYPFLVIGVSEFIKSREMIKEKQNCKSAINILSEEIE